MESRVTIFGHPVHQVLVSFPLGVLAFAVVSDAAAALACRRRVRRARSAWKRTAKAAMGAGLVGGVMAAPFGLADYLAVPHRTRAKAVGLAHGIGNACVLSLFLASWLLRRAGKAPRAATALSSIGLALAGGTSWLGGELINRFRVGVIDGLGVRVFETAGSSLARASRAPSCPQDTCG